MTRLHELRELIKAFYGRYTPYIDGALKGISALIIYIIINVQLGFSKQLGNPFIIILLSLFSAVLPWKFITLAGIALIMIHINAVSLWYAVLVGTLLLIMFLLYFHISIERGIFLILMPIAFFLKIPYVIPVAAGLLSGPVEVFAIIFGMIFYHVIIFSKGSLLPMLSGSDKELSKVVETLSETGKYLFKNPALILYLLVFSSVLIIVYFIRRLAIRYSWFIAIGVGNVVMFVALLLGDFKMDIPIKFHELFLGIIFSMITNIIITFFAFNIDYAATEHLQFEDEEYYYYVKAIPKISISVGKRRVQRITDKKPNSVYKTDDIDPEKGASGR